MNENILFKSSHSAIPARDEILYKLPKELIEKIESEVKESIGKLADYSTIIIPDYIIVKIEK